MLSDYLMAAAFNVSYALYNDLKVYTIFNSLISVSQKHGRNYPVKVLFCLFHIQNIYRCINKYYYVQHISKFTIIRCQTPKTERHFSYH